jgi:large subunit ribosomal protein L17
MNHGNKVNPLGRKAAHRKALMANLAIALIEHKRITTTLAKARELRKYIEPMVTKSKDDTTHNRRVVFSYLQNKDSIKELFSTVREKVGDRPGGYVRVIKIGFRKSDGAEMAMIEFVDFNDVYQTDKAGAKTAASKRRGRRGGKATTTAKPAETAPVVAVEEEIVDAAEEAIEPATDAADQPAAETTEENKEDKE